MRQQVMPYVDNDIRNDWLTPMRSTLAGVATSYDMVTDRMAAAPATRFEIPGDLGPGSQPCSRPRQAHRHGRPVAPAAAAPSLSPAGNPGADADLDAGRAGLRPSPPRRRLRNGELRSVMLRRSPGRRRAVD